MSTPLRERPDAPLGTLIFRAGLLPAETIESALEEGVKTGKRLGEILTERGLISEVDLARLLAGQKGLDFVTLREQIVDTSAAGLFTEEQAKLFRALPYGFEDGMPVVAIADPTDEVLLRNIREGLGREDIKFVVSTRGELLEISTDVYSKPLQVAPAPAPEPAAEPVSEATPEPEAAPEPEAVAAPETVAEPEPVAEVASEPLAEPAPEPQAEAAPELQPEPEAEAGWPQISPDPTPDPEPEPEPAPTAHEHEPVPAPEPALDPEPAPEAPAVPHTNGVVPPEAAPLLQVPAPEAAAPIAPEPAPVEAEPVLQVPAPEPLPQVEQPAPEPVAPVEPVSAPRPLQVSEHAPEPAPQPEPVLEPAATVEPLRVPEPAPTPEPVPTLEPIASPEPAPLPEPTPPPAPYPPAAAQPEPEAQPEPTPEPEPDLQPEPEPAAPELVVAETPVAEESTALWRVLIRLTNGERVDAGDFSDPEGAKQHARSLMSHLADAEQGDWPFVDGRFLKPDTIVSVDIAEHDGDGLEA